MSESTKLKKQAKKTKAKTLAQPVAHGKKGPSSKPASADPKPPASSSKAAIAAATPDDSKPDTAVVTTRTEAAAELRRRIGKGSVRTLADWFKQGCPGKPGEYDVDAIEAWVAENVGIESEFEQVLENQGERAYWSLMKIREQALKAQAERLLLEEKLVDTEEVSRLIERLAGMLLSMLGQWPDWVLSLLPGNVKPNERRSIRDNVGTKVDELGHSIADMLSEWTKPEQKGIE